MLVVIMTYSFTAWREISEGIRNLIAYDGYVYDNEGCAYIGIGKADTGLHGGEDIYIYGRKPCGMCGIYRGTGIDVGDSLHQSLSKIRKLFSLSDTSIFIAAGYHVNIDGDTLGLLLNVYDSPSSIAIGRATLLEPMKLHGLKIGDIEEQPYLDTIVAVGYTYDPYLSLYEGVVAIFDTSHSIIRNFTFHALYSIFIKDVEYTQLATHMVAGGIYGDNIFVIKFDINGNIIWVKEYGGSGEDKFSAITINGYNKRYVLTGYTNSFGCSFGNCMFIMETDTSGYITKQTLITFGTYNVYPTDIIQHPATGEFIISGYLMSVYDTSLIIPFVIQTDTNFHIIRSKAYIHRTPAKIYNVYLLHPVIVGFGKVGRYPTNTFNIVIDADSILYNQCGTIDLEYDQTSILMNQNTIPYQREDIGFRTIPISYNIAPLGDESVCGNSCSIDDLGISQDTRPSNSSNILSSSEIYYTADGRRVVKPNKEGVYFKIIDGRVYKIIKRR